MSKQELMKMQTCVLKVNIQCHCDGCKKKIKKLLQQIDGVYHTQINAEQEKVTVTGNFDPAALIKKLEKSGKHAELWGAPKGFNNFQNQFKNMQLDHGKGGGGGGGKDNKSQKGGKGGQQVQHQLPQFKGSKDVKMPFKDNKKSVKFNLQDDYADASDDEDFDDEFDEDEDDEEFGHGHQWPKQMMPMMNNGHVPNGPHGMINGPMFSNQKSGGGGGGGNGKKGSGEFEMLGGVKAKGGKNSKGDKKGGSGDAKNGQSHSKSEVKKQGGKDKSKNSSKSILGGLLNFGKKGKNGRAEDTTDKKNNDNIFAGNNNSKGPKKGGGKNAGVHDSNKTSKQGYHNEFEGNGTGAKNFGKTGQMGPMGPTGYFPAVQGMPASPAMNYQGMGGGNPYDQLQQQQYMAMMMNQQRQYGSDMYQPMMYARPYPPVNYMPPPPMSSHPMSDPYAQAFSDENTDSCSIM